CPYPHGETEPPLASAGDPPTPAAGPPGWEA
ncbi:hypothetical protein J1605_004630, partial [Eschrichtius robustus]